MARVGDDDDHWVACHFPLTPTAVDTPMTKANAPTI